MLHNIRGWPDAFLSDSFNIVIYLLYTFVIKKKMRDLGKLALIIIIVVVLLCAVYWRLRSHICTITFFHRPNCGYCKIFYPEWDTFVAKAPRGMNLRKINVLDPQWNQLVEKCGVRSVPLIVKDKFGRRVVYKGTRKANDLYDFAMS